MFDSPAQLPVYGVPAPDRVYMLEAALVALESGQLMMAAQLVDSMMRDERINGVLHTRIDSVLGAERELTPGKDTARGRRIAEDLDESWEKMHPTSVVGQVHAWGIMLNVGLAERMWDTSTTPWTYKLRFWHPQFLNWRWDTHSYWLTTADKGLVEIDPASPQWWLHTPRGYDYSYMHGLVRSLAKPWMIRQWTARDWARYNEVHGLPVRKAKVPENASDREKQLFFASIANMASETALRLPVNDEGHGFDLELTEATANSWEGFKEALLWADKCITIAVNGQAMSTEGQAGLGSQEKGGEAVRSDVKRWDSHALATSLEPGLRQWVELAHGDDAFTPTVEWLVDPPEDSSEKATEYKTLADAISVFKAAGAPIDVRAILEEAGIPMLDESDAEAATKAEHPGFLQAAEPDPSTLPPGQPGKPTPQMALPLPPAPGK